MQCSVAAPREPSEAATLTGSFSVGTARLLRSTPVHVSALKRARIAPPGRRVVTRWIHPLPLPAPPGLCPVRTRTGRRPRPRSTRLGARGSTIWPTSEPSKVVGKSWRLVASQTRPRPTGRRRRTIRTRSRPGARRLPRPAQPAAPLGLAGIARGCGRPRPCPRGTPSGVPVAPRRVA